MTSRLSLALAAGAVALPEGRIVLLRPPGDLSLNGLPASELVAEQGFRPDHDALAARGIHVAARIEGPAAGAVVFAGRAKARTLDLLARACTMVEGGGPVVVDGAKADGIESVLRLCRGAFDVGEVFSKAHGKCFGFAASPAPADWAAATRFVDGFETRPGLFSADGIDPGSAVLAGRLGGLSGRVCDLGSGWGYLASVALRSEAVTELALVEAEAEALDCARANVVDARVSFHWADATRFEGGPFDVVVSNPPFHVSRKADPALGRAFVAAAARLLSPRGRLLMVANRHLPYEATIAATFGEVVVLEDAGGYKVLEARRPKRRRA